MEGLIKEVVNLLNDFAKQEMGNRLSTYSWGTFINTLIGIIKKYKPEEKMEVKKEYVKK